MESALGIDLVPVPVPVQRWLKFNKVILKERLITHGVLSVRPRRCSSCARSTMRCVLNACSEGDSRRMHSQQQAFLSAALIFREISAEISESQVFDGRAVPCLDDPRIWADCGRDSDSECDAVGHWLCLRRAACSVVFGFGGVMAGCVLLELMEGGDEQREERREGRGERECAPRC